MARPLVLVPLVLAAPSAVAQLAIDATFVTATEFVARSTVFSQRLDNTWPVGTDLTRASVLTAGQSGFGSAIATTRIGWSNTARGLTASITETNQVSGLAVFASTGLHSARLRLSSRQATPVRVRAVVTGSTLGHCTQHIGTRYGGGVDFGGDGQLDLAAAPGTTRNAEWTVTLDASGIEIVTISGGQAGIVDSGGEATSRGEVRIEVVPVDAVVVDWLTDTPIVCSAPFVATATLARGSSLWPNANVAVGPCGNNRATVGSVVTAAPDRVLASLTEGVASAGFGDATIPVHDSILFLRAPVPTPVRVTIRISASATFFDTADWSAALDIGDDGSFEVVSVLNRAVVHEALVVADPAGLRLRLRARGTARPTGAADGSVEVAVLPALACMPVPRGSACGVALSGLVTLASRLELDVTTPAPDTVAKLLLGTQQADQPLPFSPCRLYTVPVLALPFVTGARGSTRFGFDLPPGLGGTLVVQSLALARSDPLELAASRALDVVCQ